MDAMLSVFRSSVVYLLVVEALGVEMFSLPHIFCDERRKISIVFFLLHHDSTNLTPSMLGP